MKKCGNCGQMVEDDELFCGACGSRVEESAAAEAGEEQPAFCPNCGAKMEEGAFFCANCGFDIRTTPSAAGSDTSDTAKAPSMGKKKPMDNKKIGLIATGVAALAVILLVVKLAGGLFSSPAQKFASYQSKFFVDGVLEKAVGIVEYWNNYTLSTDMTITAESGNRELNYLLDDSAIGVQVDLKENSVMAGADLTLMGSEVVSGMVSYEAGKAGFYIPELDDTYYTVNLVQAAELFGTDLSGLEKAGRMKIPTDLMKKIGKRYVDIVLSVANKDNVTVDKDKKIRFDALGGSVTGTVYTLEPEAEDVEALVIKLADTIEKDKQLREFVVALAGQNVELYESMYPNFDLGDLEGSADEFLVDLADELRDYAEESGRQTEQAGFQWKLCMEGNKIRKISVENYGGEVSVGFESKDDEMAVYSNSYGYLNSVLLEYEKKDGGYSGKVSVGSSGNYGAEGVSMSFKNVTDTKSALGLRYGTYVLSANGERMELEVKKSDKGGTEHVLELPGTYDMGNITVTLHTTDKKSTIAPPKGKAMDISDYDMQDYMELAQDWESAINRIANDLDFSRLMNMAGYLW